MQLFLCGRLGRMGTAIRELAVSKGDIELLSVPAPGCVMIDFTAPGALETHIALALEHQSPLLVGTTGLGGELLQHLQKASHHIPVLQAPNTSLGANLLYSLTRIASKALSDFDCFIHDIHHRHKKDAPSGTALALQKAAGRNAHITSEREGESAGIHEVSFSNSLEKISLKHEVSDRKVFAIGALLAARFLFQKKPGLYSMQDVLGLPRDD